MLSWSMVGFVDVSNALRILAIELNKISMTCVFLFGQELVFLKSSSESNLALPYARKDKSVIAEAVNMVCFQVAGNDHAVAWPQKQASLSLM